MNSFIFRFDTPEKVLREKMAYEFYHYPMDFLERYRSEVEKVTSDDVARVAHKYVHKDRLAVLVVGNDTEFGKPLSSLGRCRTCGHHHPTTAAGADGRKRAGRAVGVRDNPSIGVLRVAALAQDDKLKMSPRGAHSN